MLVRNLTPTILFSIVKDIVQSRFLVPGTESGRCAISLVTNTVMGLFVGLVAVPGFNTFNTIIKALYSRIILVDVRLFCIHGRLPLGGCFRGY